MELILTVNLSPTDRGLLTQIVALLQTISTQETKIMVAIDDLNTALTTLVANFTTLDTAIQAELVAITAALASGNTAAIEAAVTNIGTVSGKMAADAAALTQSLTVQPPAA
jgi:hypothetical protein